jgi:Ca2+-binding EF-hand superfamily protein
MSVGGVGATGSNYLSQTLSALLSQLSTTQAASFDASSSTTTTASTGTSSPVSGCSANNSLTGSTSPSLSSEILNVLMQMQQDSSASSTTASASQGTAQNPLQQLFGAMDTNGDGSVSQSEMENYIEQQGSTQAQADQLYASISQNGQSQSGAGGISENQLAQAAGSQNGPSGAHGHHHHHHHKTGESTNDLADSLVQAMDTNGDGQVSQDEFTSFVTQNGGTASEASTDFAAFDTSGTGSIGASQFATAIQNLQAQQFGSQTSPWPGILDTLAQNASGAASTTSVSA